MRPRGGAGDGGGGAWGGGGGGGWGGGRKVTWVSESIVGPL